MNHYNTPYHKQKIIAEALKLGFNKVGFAKAQAIDSMNENHLREWIDSGMEGEMSYMRNNFDKRIDPTKLVEGCQTVIVLAMNYYPQVKQEAEIPQISMYAYGKDYHDTIRERLKSLLNYIDTEITPCTGRGFTDSAPILERYWAQKAGVGFIGKNNMLIIPNSGSFFFLAALLVDIELTPDAPMSPKCGNCNRCLEACPTKAITSPRQLDSRKCISYLTIEYKGDIPQDIKPYINNRLYGCDLCQTCCPWNRFATPNTIDEFQPNDEILQLDKEKLSRLTKDDFSRIFKGSAVKRTKYEGLIRNFNAISCYADDESEQLL
ncbi:MAG: tRNA epoxyqueuosine(34) reductase QueG [Bacteroidales bacterium]